LVRGWKDIARQLGVSAKTAQRYELEFGLPVRRKKQRYGSSVYALRSELTSWLAGRPEVADSQQCAEEEHSPTKWLGLTRPRWVWAIIFALVLLVVAASLRWRMSRRSEPVSWEIRQNRLLALGAEGKTLWQQAFGFPLEHAAYRDYGASPHPPVLIEDLDGDGPPELLFLAIDAAQNLPRGFYCFNHDGSVRFSVDTSQPLTRVVEFGGQRFAPPYEPCLFQVALDARGKKSVFVVSQVHSWFPAAVLKFSARGQLQGEFWHPGHVQRLLDITVGGRRLLLAGGMNNEHVAAGLAVLDFDNLSGYGPASNPKYLCRNCPEGAPVAYFVFPRTEISRAVDHRPYVRDLSADVRGALTVTVAEAGGPPPAEPSAHVVYRLDSEFRLIQANFDDQYRGIHSRLRLAGGLDHPLRPEETATLRNVLYWAGDPFRTMTASDSPMRDR
jgi:hypothetical protein